MKPNRLAALLLVAACLAAPAWADDEPRVDLLTPNLSFKNIGSRLDGKGMCVFTAVEYCLRWAGLEEWRGFRDWCAERYPGGGTPAKLEQLLQDYAKAKGLPDPRGYVLQAQGDTWPLIELALKTRRPVAITDSGNRANYGQDVAHMTTLVGFGEPSCVVDNNFPRVNEWLTKSELVRRHSWRNYRWCVLVLAPPPPPIPANRRAAARPLENPMLALSLASFLAAQDPCPGGVCPPGFVGAPPRRRFQPAPYFPVQPMPVMPAPGPVDGARPARPQLAGDLLTGVDQAGLEALPPDQTWTRFAGKTQVQRHAGGPQFEAMTDGRLEDDSHKATVVIGLDDERGRKRIEQQLRASPRWRELERHCTLQAFPLKAWQVDVGYGGAAKRAGITIVGPADEKDQATEFGFVPLADRQADLAPDLVDEVLDAAQEATRRGRPDYAPSRPRAGRSAEMGEAAWMFAVAAVVFLVVFGAIAAVAALAHQPADPAA